MRSDKAEPGDNPRQPQIINKGSVRAGSVPARTAKNPRQSSRIKTRPQATLTARDERAKTRTINKQVIGSKWNNVKHASRKRIVSLIKTQLKIDKATTPPAKKHNKTTPSDAIPWKNQYLLTTSRAQKASKLPHP